MSLSKFFITMDLETRTINEVMTSYCVNIFDGETPKRFFLSDFSNGGNNAEQDILRASILYLMKRKYHNHRIYLHNFSRFEAIFLISTLSYLTDRIKPIMRNGQLIGLRFKFGKKYTLFFRDSLLKLPATLSSLANNFNVENKAIFPYNFVNNSNISLTYSALVPEYKYF